MAIEELNKSNREKQLLVARIKHLEAEKQAGVGKGKKVMVPWPDMAEAANHYFL